MLKKILATALAAAMILGLASVAFAASFSDTADNAKETAIKRLAGLGLLNGYPDGTFRPENPITRAEFSKVIVYALGLKEAAEMLTGIPVGFPDVPANHWATGFISIASSQGIVNGYPDGTFKPEANVTYAEAITMIMRALGYDPLLKNGVWPTAYLTKASTLGVSKGVTFNAAAPATRDNVAALINNALTKGRLVESGYFGDQIQYEVDPNSTLLSAMGAEKADGWLVVSPELFDVDDDEIEVVLTADFGDDEADDQVEFTLADDTEFVGLLGHKVAVWLNNDGEVFFIEDKSAEDDVVTAAVESETEIEVDDEIYDVDDAVYEFYNFTAAMDDLADGDIVTAVFDGDTLMSVFVVSYRVGIVDTVNTVYDRITFRSGSLRLADYDVIWSGAAAEVGDLEEDDVVEYVTDGDDEAYVVVTRNAVTGEFTRLTPATNASAYVDGVKYTEAVGYNVPDLLGDEVVVLLDQFGKIQFMYEVEGAAAVEHIAIVVATGVDEGPWSDVGLVRLFTAAGEVVELECTSGFYDDGTGDWFDLEAGDVISYTVNSSGRLNGADELAAIADAEDDMPVSKAAKLITFDGDPLKLSSSTVIFNVSDFVYDNAGTWEVADGADEDDIELYALADLLANAEVTGVVVPDGGKADVVLVFDVEGAEDTFYGYVTGIFNEEDVQGVSILVEGDTTEYLFDEDYSRPAAIGSNDRVRFILKGGAITEIVELTPEALPEANTEYRVVDVDDEVIEIAAFYTDDHDVEEEIGTMVENSTEYLLVDGNTLYYDKTGSIKSIELDDVAVDSIVQVFMNDVVDHESEGMLAILVVID